MKRRVSWKELVVETLRKMGGEGSLGEIIESLRSHPLRPQTRTWQATIRRVVREFKVFEPFRDQQGIAAYRLVTIEQPSPPFAQPGTDPHGEQQGMLLQLGRWCGYETFTNATDRTIRKMGGIPIGDLATVRNDADSLRGLPLQKIRNTDVLWLAEDAEGLYPRYAFEVEESTKVKSGLLRLLRIPSRFQTRLLIIGKGEEEAHLFRRYLQDSPFREASRRLHFHSYEEVRAFYRGGSAFDVARRAFEVELNYSI